MNNKRVLGGIRYCPICKNEISGHNKNRKKFCGSVCYWRYRKENKMYPPSQKGKSYLGRHWKIKDTSKMKGRIPWNKNKKFPQFSGEKHPNWKGGYVKHLDKRIRKSLEYRLWRKSVFERDNYTCVWCGKRGCKLNADHIKPFAFFPELRFAIDNGRTLCVECHKTTETYGRPKSKQK